MNWPQALWIVLVCLQVCAALALHGTVRRGRHRYWPRLAWVGVELSVLYAGGFFSGAVATCLS